MRFTWVVRLPLYEEPAMECVAMDCELWLSLKQVPRMSLLKGLFIFECAFGPYFIPQLHYLLLLKWSPQLCQEFSEKKTWTERPSRKYWVWLLDISGENEPFKSTGIYLRSVLLWQAFKNKTSTLRHFKTLWIRLWYFRVSFVHGMKSGDWEKKNLYKTVFISLGFFPS